MPRTTEHAITMSDLRNLMTGEGGVDLERIAGQSAMRIVGVKPGTTAARLGAENGDTIESINDMPLVSVAAAYQAADVAANQERIVIKGKRGAEPYVTVLQMTK
jgi:S1-C subfamily serine protease